MDVTPLIPEGRQIIQRYGADGFKVSGVVHHGATIVMPEGTRNWPSINTFEGLSVETFEPLISIANELDVVLLGTGGKGEFFPPKLRQSLKEKGLSIEVMDTGAACRTYNVLMAEGRRVAAALLPIV